MPDLTCIAQISDAHLRVGGDDGASARALEAAVRALVALDPAPLAIVISGDLVDGGTSAEYERARELLAPLTVPVHVVAGNHDDRDALRACFGPAADGPFVQYATSVGPLRLVVCDTMLPRRNEGSYGPDRLGWLEAELATDLETPTVIAMHHPPLVTGIPLIDDLGLPAVDQRRLAEAIAPHPQVQRIVAGHVHRTITGTLSGRGVLVCPSSYLQLRLLPVVPDELSLTREPPGFALHVLAAGALTSHVHPIGF